jgi:hypothetical protein
MARAVELRNGFNGLKVNDKVLLKPNKGCPPKATDMLMALSYNTLQKRRTTRIMRGENIGNRRVTRWGFMMETTLLSRSILRLLLTRIILSNPRKLTGLRTIEATPLLSIPAICDIFIPSLSLTSL